MNNRFKYEISNNGRIIDYDSDSDNKYDIYEGLLPVTSLLNDLNNKNNIKSELIQELLFNYVRNLGLSYDNYFQIIDDDMVSDDEMYIFIDRWKKGDCDDLYGNPISDKAYEEYLKDFKKYCDEFIDKLKNKLPKNLGFTEKYFEITDEDFGDNMYMDYCSLHFRILYE